MSSFRSARTPAALLALFLSTLLSGVGCQKSAAVKVHIEGIKVPREYAVSVEVTNIRGDVQVYASDRIKEPEVRARARSLDSKGPETFSDLAKTITVRAVTSEEGGRRMFRVTGNLAGDASSPIAVDLQIRIPKANGVRVVNSGGNVELVGVSGAISVENGGPGKGGGSVEVRTGMAMTQAVTLSTTEGGVLYQVGRGSTGDLDLRATGGMPQVDAKIGTLGAISYQADRLRGTLDDGKNPIRLHTDKGDVRMLVLENAGEYGKEYWDGWPQWPTSPRWVSKLAGP